MVRVLQFCLFDVISAIGLHCCCTLFGTLRYHSVQYVSQFTARQFCEATFIHMSVVNINFTLV